MHLNVDNHKDGRRVQLFNFKRSNDRHPVTCEVSDKTNYMRAALTKKSVKAFERTMERAIETMSGMAIQIQTFRIMLFTGHSTAHKRKRGKGRDGCLQSAEDGCPQRIRDGKEPQLWMLITRFAYLGGEGNTIYDQPRHIKLDPRVAEVMAELLAQSTKQPDSAVQINGRDAKSEKQIDTSNADEHEGQKQIDKDETESNAEAVIDEPNQVQKRRRSYLDTSPLFSPLIPPPSPIISPPSPIISPPSPIISPLELIGSVGAYSSAGAVSQGPTIGQVPFVSDGEAAWACSSFWQSLSIQAACVSVMPVHGMFESQDPARTPNRALSDVPRAPDGSSNDHAPSHVQVTRWQPTGSPARGRSQITPLEARSSLGGLLIPADAGLMSAGAIMEQMYGAMSSPVLDDHCTYMYGTDGIDANMLLGESLGWESSLSNSAHCE
ncbi:hypothetical protein LPJ58_002077 [Coemansia sp. RSA 1591]|nr:hypothetical protein LPJ58_002077 [Coemansia sp. RSA 1591]KAJ1764152.1 hypothetical protein LPJ69_002019 [Coemansia sp. RSA 1752]KAJ2441716.1 hypothetical protein IWW46_003377 [Coemansia sp. RSA 2440]